MVLAPILMFSLEGIEQGFQPVSDFNYGAGKYDRLRKSFRFTVIISEGIIVVGCTLLFIFSGGLIGIFRDDSEVIEIGGPALRLQALAQLVLPPCMAVEMLYQSTGKRLGASILSSLRNGIIFIPVPVILSSIRGLSGIQEAQPVAIPFGIAFFRKLPDE